MKRVLRRTLKKGSLLSRIKNYSPKTRVKVNIFTVIIVALSLIFGRFNYLFLHYMIAFIHELSHFLMARVLRVEVETFTFLPFGFYADIPKLEKEKPLRQLLIVISGPLSFFLVWALAYILYSNYFFSSYSYEYVKSIALTIALFNMIPLYPLDGARICEILVAFKCDELKTRIVRIVLSALSYIGLFFLCIRENQLIVLVFLSVSLILEVISFKKKYIYFLLCRMVDSCKRPLKINKKMTIYRYRNNKYLNEGRLVSEIEFIPKLISSIKHKLITHAHISDDSIDNTRT